MLDEDQANEVKEEIIKRFGEECVKRIDMHFMKLADLRAADEKSDTYDFLQTVQKTYLNPTTEEFMAAILFGMKLGELGVLFAQEQEEEDRKARKKARKNKKQKRKQGRSDDPYDDDEEVLPDEDGEMPEGEGAVKGYKGNFSEQMYG